jgi:hypothetical protein
MPHPEFSKPAVLVHVQEHKSGSSSRTGTDPRAGPEPDRGPDVPSSAPETRRKWSVVIPRRPPPGCNGGQPSSGLRISGLRILRPEILRRGGAAAPPGGASPRLSEDASTRLSQRCLLAFRPWARAAQLQPRARARARRPRSRMSQLRAAAYACGGAGLPGTAALQRGVRAVWRIAVRRAEARLADSALPLCGGDASKRG